MYLIPSVVKSLTLTEVRSLTSNISLIPSALIPVLVLAKTDYDLPKLIKDELSCACGINLNYVDSLQNLFSAINQQDFNFPLVLIGGWPDIFTESDTSLIEVIDAVRTMIKCAKKNIKIAVGINSTLDYNTIQKIKRMPIDYIWPGSQEFDIETKIETMTAILRGDKFTHPKLLPLLNHKKKIIKTADTIQLTARQLQILDLVVNRGANNKTIARMLKISESSVKSHIGLMLKKYSLKNRTQLAVFCKS